MNKTDRLLTSLTTYLTKKKPHISQIQKDLSLKDYEVLGLITLLNQKGYSLIVDDKGYIIKQNRYLRKPHMI